MNRKREIDSIKDGDMSIDQFIESYLYEPIRIIKLVELYKKAKDPSYIISTKVQDEYKVNIEAWCKNKGLINNDGFVDDAIKSKLLSRIKGTEIWNMKYIKPDGTSQSFYSKMTEQLIMYQRSTNGDHIDYFRANTQHTEARTYIEEMLGKSVTDDWFLKPESVLLGQDSTNH